jgi:hypothetical protein
LRSAGSSREGLSVRAPRDARHGAQVM